MKRTYLLLRQSILVALILVSLSTKAQSVNIKVDDDVLKITPAGRMYLDGATFIDDKTDLSNGVTMSDLRLGIKAKYKSWEVKMDIGYHHSKVSAKDVFVQYNLNKSSYFRLGNYYESYALDQMESTSNTAFITKNASAIVFGPNRKIGLSYIGWKKLYWVSAGAFADSGALNNDKEGDDGYSVNGRFVFTPFKEKGKILHLGLAGVVRKADANGRDEDGIDKYNRQFKFSTPIVNEVDKTQAIDISIPNADFQAKYAAELIAGWGPVYFQGEYFHSNVKRRMGLPSYISDGAYGQIGFLAIGGDYNYSSAWARMSAPRAGSLEFAARYNYTNLDRGNFKGGTMSDITLGANYYLNKYMAVKLNYSYASLGKNAKLANENISVFSVRYQVVF